MFKLGNMHVKLYITRQTFWSSQWRYSFSYSVADYLKMKLFNVKVW